MLKQLYAGSTSACFELENREAYYAPKPYTCTCGEVCFRGESNVFSLFDLKPDSRYTLRLCYDGGGEETLTFSTKPETCAFDVRRFGAVGDGANDDTTAIQTAISALPAGGRLYFPPGTYLTRPLTLKSHMTLELARDATILGVPDRLQYPVIPGDVPDLNTEKVWNLGGFEGSAQDMYQSLVTAQFAEDIAIVGQGTVDGNAQNTDFWTNFHNFAPARPRLMFFNRCSGITVHGITACNAGAWHLHPYYSKKVAFYDIHVTAPANSPNTDALDPEACDEVWIIGCRFSVGDDCIAVKSGKIDMGKKYRVPASRHVIRNCLMEFGHGAVTLGSEIAAGVEDLTVTQCFFSHTDRGLRIKTRRGRGKLCRIDRVVFEHIRMEGVLTPFVVNMWYNCCDPDRYSEYNRTREALPVDDRTPHLGSFAFRHIRCEAAQVAACYIDGLPESPIDRVVFSDVSVSFAPDAKPGKPAMLNDGIVCSKMGFYLDNVREAEFTRVSVENVDGKPIVAGNCEQVSVTELSVK